MKKLTLAFAAALLPVLASAEIAAGTIQVSGATNLSALTGTQEVTISTPGVPDEIQKTDHWNFNLETGALYYLTPMIGVGFDLGYASDAREEKWRGEKTTFTDLFIGPKAGIDLPVAEKLSVFGDLSIGLVRHTLEFEDLVNSLNNEKHTANGFGFGIGAGVKYFVVPALSLDAGLSYKYESYSYDFQGSSYDVKDGNFGLVVGVSGYFGGKK
jgi:opacity protein-like surface antigen